MADIGDEIFSGDFEFFHPGEVMEDQHGAMVLARPGLRTTSSTRAREARESSHGA